MSKALLNSWSKKKASMRNAFEEVSLFSLQGNPHIAVGAAKIKSQLSQPTQGRLTSFFTVKKPAAEPPKKSVAKKAPVKGKKK